MRKREFDILQFPYPIAESYSYVPNIEAIVRRAPVEAIQRAAICYEAICRFCVWEMIVEYSRLGQRHEALNNFLANKFFFREKSCLTIGEWTELLRELSRYLRRHTDSLFMPQMPLVYFAANAETATETARLAINPFPKIRNRLYGHPDTPVSASVQAKGFWDLREKLEGFLGSLAFLQDYSLMAITEIDGNKLKEACVLKGRYAEFFDCWRGEILLSGNIRIDRDMTLLVRREALASDGPLPFLLYPVFLFGSYKSDDKSDVASDLFVLSRIETERKAVTELVFSGHRKDMPQRTYKEDRNNPSLIEVMDGFRAVLQRIGLGCECHSEAPTQGTRAKLQLSPFDTQQEDKIRNLVNKFLQRPLILARIDEFLGSEDRCLLVTGEPGIGKSALAAHVISSLRREGRPVAFHLIEANKPERRNWKKIIASLLFQMRQALGNALDQELIIPQESFNDEEVTRVFHEGLRRTNEALERTGGKLLIVVDGLDELHASLNDFIDDDLRFIPDEMLWERVQFLVTSRPGLVQERFIERLAADLPERLEMQRMTPDELQDLALLYNLTLNSDEVDTLVSVTNGSPLYLRCIFTDLGKRRDMVLSELPRSVIEYFRSDLMRKHRVRENPILKDVLAVLMVFRIHPSDWHIKEVLGVGISVVEKALLRLSSYLVTSEGRTYGFFHDKFKESLTAGRDPIITQEDIAKAHQRVIAWCEPFERVHEVDPQFEYGFEYLPYHYWKISSEDRYRGFLDLLGRGSFFCEFSVRRFILAKVTSRPEKDLIDDRELIKLYERFFFEGNDFVKRALIRSFDDSLGYGYVKFRKMIWENILQKLPEEGFWRDEIFRVTAMPRCGRLEIINSRLARPEAISCLLHLRGLYASAATRLCNVEFSGDRCDMEEGLEYWNKVFELIEEIESGRKSDPEKTPGHIPDARFDRYGSNNIKGSYRTTYANALMRLGRFDEAREALDHALASYNVSLAMQLPAFLETRVERYCNVTRHHKARCLCLAGDLRSALEVWSDVMAYRAGRRMLRWFFLVLGETLQIFESCRLHDIARFLGHLIHAMSAGHTREERIIDHERSLPFLIKAGRIDEAGVSLRELVSARMELEREEYRRHVLQFKNAQDQMEYLFATGGLEEAVIYMREALDILEKHGEWRTLMVPDPRYYRFWETVVLICLKKGDVARAKGCLETKLDPWFSEFRLRSLLPRYYNLKTVFFEEMGSPDQAQTARDEMDRLVTAARQSITGWCFPPEVVQYMDYLVASASDSPLKSLYHQIRVKLTDGIVHGANGIPPEKAVTVLQ